MSGRVGQREGQVGKFVLDESLSKERGILPAAVLDVATGADPEHRTLGVQRLTIVDNKLAVSTQAVTGREAVASLVSQLAVLVFRHIRRLVFVRTVPCQVQVGLTGDIEFLSDVPST